MIIPTLNCARQLEECLRSIRSQSYSGKVNVIIVDGGSLDDTIAVGKRWGDQVRVMPGVFSTGLDGARNLALSFQSSPLTWQVDADNVVQGEDALSSLAAPFLSINDLQVSAPVCWPDPGLPAFDRYLAYRERAKLLEAGAKSEWVGEWRVCSDLSYGITNCSLIRTDLLREVGGYDSDMRVWERARTAGRSKGCVMPDVHYLHFTGGYLGAWLRKQSSRYVKYSRFSEASLERYLHPQSRTHSPILGMALDTISQPFWGAQLWFADPRAALYSVAVPVVSLGMVATKPFTSYKLLRGYFGRGS